MTAFCNHALVTKERMAIPLDLTLEFQEFWTAHPRGNVFGSRTDALPNNSLNSPSAIQCMTIGTLSDQITVTAKYKTQHIY